MNTNNFTGPEGPEIPISLLLKFLVEKFKDALKNDPPEVTHLLQGLGYAALSSDKKLSANYTGILASPYLPPREMIRRSIEIFKTALKDHPDGRAIQQSRETGKDPDEKSCRQFLLTALREGKIMEKEGDYRFFRVFEILGWIGLQCDHEWLTKFETVSASYRNDPENLVKKGRDILVDVLFKRRPSDPSCVSGN